MSEKLSKEDQSRVDNCEYYLRTKQVMKNVEAYKDLAIGEVYFIKHKDYSDKEVYICGGWNDEPAKFMVFHKDEGFVFIRRIIANGKMGKEVICLTTQYDVGTHWLEPDPDYVNSILLEDEDGYDPMAASKKLSSNKNKARRRNKKLEINYDSYQEALDFMKTLKVGDTLYDANSAYGSGMLTWRVKRINHRTVNPGNLSRGSWGRGNVDDIHSKAGFLEIVEAVVEVQDKELPKSRRWNETNQTLTFEDFMGKYNKFYKTKPYTVDDV